MTNSGRRLENFQFIELGRSKCSISNESRSSVTLSPPALVKTSALSINIRREHRARLRQKNPAVQNSRSHINHPARNPTAGGNAGAGPVKNGKSRSAPEGCVAAPGHRSISRSDRPAWSPSRTKKTHNHPPHLFAITSPPSGCVEDFHLQAIEHARHTNKTARTLSSRREKKWIVPRIKSSSVPPSLLLAQTTSKTHCCPIPSPHSYRFQWNP